MINKKQARLFFSGIGGSGMLPLALALQNQNYLIAGSDRSFDQNRTLDKKKFLESRGITIFPQDGSGLQHGDTLVVSTAVEDTVPDVRAAKDLGCVIETRAALLAKIINHAQTSICIGGTSGKSTVTGMIGWIFYAAATDPVIINGAVMENFLTPDMPYASSYVGKNDKLVIAEVDESDGSINGYNPYIAVLNNIALDHKDMPTLQDLFGRFLTRAKFCVVNIDCENTNQLHVENCLTTSLKNPLATLYADRITHTQTGSSGYITHTPTQECLPFVLNVPGNHNISNALNAIGAALLCGIFLPDAVRHLATFKGIKRRLQILGTHNGITVIDDFAHNPDKITASLQTLHQHAGRLIIMFQMHGFGTLKLLYNDLVHIFYTHLKPNDLLYMPEALYFGGTADRSIGTESIVQDLHAKGVQAFYKPNRSDFKPDILAQAKQGDRIVIMGARDDTLTDFGRDILASVHQN